MVSGKPPKQHVKRSFDESHDGNHYGHDGNYYGRNADCVFHADHHDENDDIDHEDDAHEQINVCR